MMDLIQGFLCCMLLGLALYLAVKYVGTRSCLPPGPVSFPFIGNLHLVSEHLHETLAEMGNKYGPISTFNLGQLRAVIVNDFPTAKEVLMERGTEFAGRPTIFTLDLISRGGKNIAFSDYGKHWKFHRKIAHSVLRVFGKGMTRIESVVQDEVNGVCQRFEESGTVSFDPAVDIHLMVMNVICTLLFGKTFHREDPTFLKFKDDIHYISVSGSFKLYDVIPILQWFPWRTVKTFKEKVRGLQEFVCKKLHLERQNARGKVFGEDIQATNYIQALLKSRQEAEEENHEVKEFLSEDSLVSAVIDLFLAGAEPTSTTLNWCLLYMATWPAIQDKVHIMLDQEIGKPDGINTVRLSQRQALPYLEAIIMETQRLASTVPLGLFHKALKDTTICGYDIPKGTAVVVNQWAIHHNKSYWKEPFQFDPSRFLDANGQLIHDSSKPFIPFGAGPRVCLGQALARTEMFLCLSNLLHRFHFTFPSNEEKPSLRGISKITIGPLPYRIIVKRRY